MARASPTSLGFFIFSIGWFQAICRITRVRPAELPEYVAQAIGAKLLLLPGAVNANEKVKDYFSLFDYDVTQIAAALKESK